MNKLFNKIATLSVGLAMAVGVGVAVGLSQKESMPAKATPGASPMTSVFNSKSWGVSSGDSWVSTTAGSAFNQDKGIQVYKNVTAVAVSSETYSGISKISVNAGTSKEATATVKVKVGDGTFKTWSISKNTANEDHDFDFSPIESGKVTLSVAAFSASAYCKSITITFDAGPQVNNVTLNKSSVTIDKNETATATITVSADAGASYTLAASSSNESIATASIDGTTLTVSSHDSYGNATITVSAGGRSASLLVKVVDPNSLKFLQQCTSANEITDGQQYVIAGFVSGDTYLFNAKAETSQVAGEVNSNSWNDTFGTSSIRTMRADYAMYAFSFAGNNTDGFTIQDLNDKYLGQTSGANFSRWDSVTDDKGKWTITQSDKFGSFKISNKNDNSRVFAINSDGKFAPYFNNNIDGASYFYVEIYKVVDLTGITTLSITCDGEGGNSANWSTLEGQFNGITNLAWKAYYKHAAYEKTGSGLDTVVTPLENTIDAVAQFVAKYDYIVGKYNKGQGQASYTDFIGRDPAAIGGSSRFYSPTFNENSALIGTIIIASMVGLAIVGSYLLIKRRKER